MFTVTEYAALTLQFAGAYIIWRRGCWATFCGTLALNDPKVKDQNNMSRDMRFPTMWYVQPAKAQTSQRIRAVWSEPLLVAWVFYDC